MPAAPRCCASARCARWCSGIEAVLPDGSAVRGAGRAQEGQSRLRPQAAADRRRRHARHRHRGEPEAGAGDRRARGRLGRARRRRRRRWRCCAISRRRLGDAVESFELVPAERARPGARPYPRHARRRWPRRTPWNVLIEAVAPMAAPSPEQPLYEGAALGARDRPRRGRDDRRQRGAGRGLLAAARLDRRGREEGRPGRQARHLGRRSTTWPASWSRRPRRSRRAFPGTRVIAFGHLGDGNVHFNVRAPGGRGAGLARGRGRRRSAPSSTIWSPPPAARSRPSTASAR